MSDNEQVFRCIDVREDDLWVLSQTCFDTLLRDHTTGRNIFWATHDYESLGPEYDYHSPILPELITGSRGMVIMPRVLKSRQQQTDRSKDMAEVFTPSWVCNAQNNLIDEAWFGRSEVFNREDDTTHTWQGNPDTITFTNGRTWKDYVRDTRMEITCGEAPYLVSRYDTTTGEPIPISQRIGLLDRKLRVVGENTETTGDWLNWAQEALKNTYGYEWQGDSLLLARENLLLTFIDYYVAKFGIEPLQKSINYAAYIISWNLWQMDGLKGVVPDSCVSTKVTHYDMFDGEQTTVHPCPGCEKNDLRLHNGIYCLIKDWRAKKEKQKIRFIDLIKP